MVGERERGFYPRSDSVSNRVRLAKTENVSPAITYYGWSLRQDATDADAVWLIQRTSRDNSNIAVSEWALNGQFKGVWNDRATYFAAPGSGTSAIVTPVSLFDINGNPFTLFNPLQVSAAFSGLRNGGRVTTVALNPTTWTALPLVPLAGRNAICIQNSTNDEIKINYSSAIVGYVGVVVGAGAERFYDLTDAIVIWAKSAPATTPTVLIEELS